MDGRVWGSCHAGGLVVEEFDRAEGRHHFVERVTGIEPA